MTKAGPIPGRVFRLESHLLDQELDGTIDNFVDRLEIPRCTEELKMLLRLFLYSNYLDSGTTAGMKVYNLQYCNSSEYISPRRKLIALTAMRLIISYTMKRCRTLDNFIQELCLKGLNLPWLNLDNFTLLCKSLNIINFFVFLRRGKYLTIPERILGLTPAVSEEGLVRNVQLNKVLTDFMYREVIWKSMTEFLSVVLPLINVDQVKNRMMNLTGLAPSFNSDIKLSAKYGHETKRCAICLEQQFNPYIIGCAHVFCYYCLQSKYLSDTSIGYVCRLCNFKAIDELSIQRYKSLHGALGKP